MTWLYLVLYLVLSITAVLESTTTISRTASSLVGTAVSQLAVLNLVRKYEHEYGVRGRATHLAPHESSLPLPVINTLTTAVVVPYLKYLLQL